MNYSAGSARVEQLRREAAAQEQAYLAEMNVMKKIDMLEYQLTPARDALAREIAKGEG
jgi:hypothetical protein